MKQKKGFTLIELLAVIVILAIIAIIATPIVLNIINDTKKSALLRSAELYLEGATQSVVVEQLNSKSKFTPSTCNINNDGNLLCENYAKEIEVAMKGQKPTGGTIVFSNGKITKQRLIYPEGIIERDTFGNLVFVEEGENGSTTITTPAVLKGDIYISKVEDLFTFDQKMKDYQVGEVNLILADDIDFTSDDSYRDPEDKSYGNINYDYKTDAEGNYITDDNGYLLPLIEGIKKELTTGYGLVYGISTIQDEDADLNILSFGEYATTHEDSKISDLEDSILDYNPELQASMLLQDQLMNVQEVKDCVGTDQIPDVSCFYIIDENISNKLNIEPYTKEEIDNIYFNSTDFNTGIGIFMSKYITYFDENRPSPDFKGFEDERTKILNGATEKSDIKQNIENYISTNKLDNSDFTAMWEMYEKEYLILENILNYYTIEKYFTDETAHKFKETAFAKVNYIDGQNNEIKNYFGSGGLFNYINSPIKNLKMTDAKVETSILDSVGILINHTTSDIENVEVSGEISGTKSAGGVAGNALGDKITNVISDVKVSSTKTGTVLGGIAIKTFSNIIDSSSKGTVGDGTGDICGGLVGMLGIKSTLQIKNSYSISNINCSPNNSSLSGVGGLAGHVYREDINGDKLVINNGNYKGNITTGSNSTGSVYGGLIGRSIINTEIKDSYVVSDINLTNTNEHLTIGSLVGSAGDITINSSFYKGNINLNKGTVGGIIGAVNPYNSKNEVTINNVYSLGNITSNGKLTFGGIMGVISNVNMTLENSYSYMDVSGSNLYSAHGLIGDADTSYYPSNGQNEYGTYYILDIENNFHIGDFTSSDGRLSGTVDKFIDDYYKQYVTVDLKNTYEAAINKINGTTITYDSLATVDNLKTTSWYTDTLKLSSDVWEFKAGYLPHIKGLDNQEWVSVPTE